MEENRENKKKKIIKLKVKAALRPKKEESVSPEQPEASQLTEVKTAVDPASASNPQPGRSGSSPNRTSESRSPRPATPKRSESGRNSSFRPDSRSSGGQRGNTGSRGPGSRSFGGPRGNTGSRNPGNQRGNTGSRGPGGSRDSGKPTPVTNDKDTGRNKHRTTYVAKSKSNFALKEKKEKTKEDFVLNKMHRKINRKKKGVAVIPESIEIGEFTVISDMAKKMNLKASELIQKLLTLGVTTTINETIDSETAMIVAAEFNCKVTVKSLKDEITLKDTEDEEKDLLPRSPIVTVMGHVDHGKTKLLDAIRNANVAGHESGGITQHMGAYKVKTKKGDICFLDTPGHEAFTSMRARGAEVTDIVVLVVAATEGIMPQTVEAINHAKAAEVPIIVAINKTDLPDANPERVKQQLSEHGLLPEEWGGETLCLSVSALKKTGIDELLDAITLQAEMLELKANPKKNGFGYVVESKMDIGKGSLATIIVTNGRFRIGDIFVVGTTMGKIRAMFNDKGQRIKEALPADPVEIMGFNELPEAGDQFFVVDSDSFAKEISDKRRALKKLEDNRNMKKLQLQKAMDSLATSGNIKQLKIIVKADVQGSVEAIRQSLEKLKNEEIQAVVIHSAVGAVKESDVMLASTTTKDEQTGVAILAFRVRIDSKAKEKAESEVIPIKRFNIIYELIDYVKSQIEGMIAPEITETIIGTAEILNVFKITGVGKIAGSTVKEGFIRKGLKVRLYRDGIQIWDGVLSSLKRFQDDVNEVQSGFECGLSFQNYDNFKKGDIVECYESEVKEKKFVASEE